MVLAQQAARTASTYVVLLQLRRGPRSQALQYCLFNPKEYCSSVLARGPEEAEAELGREARSVSPGRNPELHASGGHRLLEGGSSSPQVESASEAPRQVQLICPSAVLVLIIQRHLFSGSLGLRPDSPGT